MPTSDLKTSLAAEFVGIRHCTAAFSVQVPKSCTNLDPTFLYILILRIYTKFVRNNKIKRSVFASATQLYTCSHVCRVKITFEIPPNNRFVSTNEFDEMLWKLDSTNSHVRSTNPSPRFKRLGGWAVASVEQAIWSWWETMDPPSVPYNVRPLTASPSGRRWSAKKSPVRTRV